MSTILFLSLILTLSLASGAFYINTALTSATIPTTVTYIGTIIIIIIIYSVDTNPIIR
jgi:hypothetical protein